MIHTDFSPSFVVSSLYFILLASLFFFTRIRLCAPSLWLLDYNDNRYDDDPHAVRLVLVVRLRGPPVRISVWMM